ncbi:sensor histidine kinase [Clostridium saccharobutylicum]|nr:PAS domain-containing sensor histidine kinase [Clostridium saccharobutylicum]NOW19864.1 PAS domain S-box-containing protein [Clostridium saccharobutylicum]
MFINKDIISNFINENLCIITSGMLSNLEVNDYNLSFLKTRKKIRLLDTGISKENLNKLVQLSSYTHIPYDSFFIGLDYFNMFIEKILLEWKLECERAERMLKPEVSIDEKYTKLETTKNFIENKKEQLLYILDSIYECVFIMDQNYDILFINRGVEKMLHLKNFKNIIGKNVFDIGIIHDDYSNIIANRFKKVITTRTSVPLIEEKLIQYNGNVITVNIYSEPIEYKGNLCILSVIRDISEHKKSENLKNKIIEQSKLLDRAAEYDKLKTEFFANLSHEFRTPLNVMLSTLQLLNLMGVNHFNDNTKEKVTKYYHIMKQNCYRLLRLVNNLIDLTKIETQYYKLNLKNENIIEIIEDITLSVTDYAKNKGLEIIFDTDVEEKIMACDADKIERIILNLLSNAIKFTPSGGNILINIHDKGSSIIVSVKDNGTGIPLDKQEYIFKRFIQVDKSLSRNREGSGIGLSLVKSLVELHKGNIKLISTYGEGSEFIMEFPISVLPSNEKTILDENLNTQTSIEMINIEFSDIYD